MGFDDASRLSKFPQRDTRPLSVHYLSFDISFGKADVIFVTRGHAFFNPRGRGRETRGSKENETRRSRITDRRGLGQQSPTVVVSTCSRPRVGQLLSVKPSSSRVFSPWLLRLSLLAERTIVTNPHPAPATAQDWESASFNFSFSKTP